MHEVKTHLNVLFCKALYVQIWAVKVLCKLALKHGGGGIMMWKQIFFFFFTKNGRICFNFTCNMHKCKKLTYTNIKNKI